MPRHMTHKKILTLMPADFWGCGLQPLRLEPSTTRSMRIIQPFHAAQLCTESEVDAFVAMQQQRGMNRSGSGSHNSRKGMMPPAKLMKQVLAMAKANSNGAGGVSAAGGFLPHMVQSCR